MEARRECETENVAPNRGASTSPWGGRTRREHACIPNLTLTLTTTTTSWRAVAASGGAKGGGSFRRDLVVRQ